MNNQSFKALNIVLYEETNNYISNYIKNTEYLINIINNLLNSNSLLSKIIQIIKLETSYNSTQYTLTLDCLDFYNISYKSNDLINIIPLLNDIGVNVIQFNETEMNDYRLIFYLNWDTNLPISEINKANQENRNIFLAKNKFDFKFSK